MYTNKTEYIYKFKSFDNKTKSDSYFFIISPINIHNYDGEIFKEDKIIIKGLWFGVFPYLYPNINLTYNKYKKRDNNNYWWKTKIKIMSISSYSEPKLFDNHH